MSNNYAKLSARKDKNENILFRKQNSRGGPQRHQHSSPASPLVGIPAPLYRSCPLRGSPEEIESRASLAGLLLGIQARRPLQIKSHEGFYRSRHGPRDRPRRSCASVLGTPRRGLPPPPGRRMARTSPQYQNPRIITHPRAGGDRSPPAFFFLSTHKIEIRKNPNQKSPPLSFQFIKNYPIPKRFCQWSGTEWNGGAGTLHFPMQFCSRMMNPF